MGLNLKLDILDDDSAETKENFTSNLSYEDLKKNKVFIETYNSHLKILNEIFKNDKIELDKTDIDQKESITDIIDYSLANWNLTKSQFDIRSIIYSKMKKLCKCENDGNMLCEPNIKNIFTNFGVIGESNNEYGLVTKFGLLDDKKRRQISIMKMMSIKQFFTHNPTVILNLIHELTIGLLLNNIRKFTPAFMYTYGGIYCNEPLNDDGIFNLNKLCNREESDEIPKNSIMLMAEFINGGMTLLKFMELYKSKSEPIYGMFKGKIPDLVADIMIQLVFALEIAQKMYGFNHNDLHSGNVMIRLISNESQNNQINTSEYIDILKQSMNRVIIQIIDYGLSSVIYEGNEIKMPQSDILFDADNLVKIVIGKFGMHEETSLESLLKFELGDSDSKRLWETLPNNVGNIFISRYNDRDIGVDESILTNIARDLRMIEGMPSMVKPEKSYKMVF